MRRRSSRGPTQTPRSGSISCCSGTATRKATSVSTHRLRSRMPRSMSTPASSPTRAPWMWGLSGKALAVLPVAEASGSAKVAGQGRDRQVFGLADPLLRVSLNVYGAPALTMAEFPAYQQDIIVGVGLQVTVPLGQYDSEKLLN